MLKQMVFFPGRVVPGRYFPREGRNQELTLKRLIRKAAKKEDVLRVLSVHGDVSFDTCLTDSAPKGTQISRIPQGLRDFRNKPQVDLLFYSRPRDSVDNGVFLEDLCYCRMLLRPGAFLFLVTEGNGASCLRRAGFMKITSQKMDDGSMLIGGQRPLKNF